MFVLYLFCIFFLFLMYYLCEESYKPITVQYCIADCVSWVPRLTLLDLQTNRNVLSKQNSFVLWGITVLTGTGHVLNHFRTIYEAPTVCGSQEQCPSTPCSLPPTTEDFLASPLVLGALLTPFPLSCCSQLSVRSSERSRRGASEGFTSHMLNRCFWMSGETK